jgi:hypothetical protein
MVFITFSQAAVCKAIKLVEFYGILSMERKVSYERGVVYDISGNES